MEDALIVICICVVLPVLIVLITSLTKMNAENKRSQIIIKALEANKDVDTNKLLEAFKAPGKSAREILNGRLLRGCMYSLIGVALAVIGSVNLVTGSDFSDDCVTVPFIFGGISVAIGLSYLIVYYVTRKQVETPEQN